MLFLGDVAHPFKTPPDWSALQSLAASDGAVLNLEGPLTETTAHLGSRVLFNHTSVLPALKTINTKVAALANNHILDLPNGVANTREILAREGIETGGAGASLTDASAPLHVSHQGHEWIFLNAGWTTIQCPPAGHNTPGTCPLDSRALVARITGLRAQNPGAVIVPMLHWNYELEPHPQPAHRRLAFAMIEAGADLIIGHHPHCVGGFEYHNDRLIAWSLGNWWLPQGVFFDGRLSYPDDTLNQVALEWHLDAPARLHRFAYEREQHTIRATGSETLSPTADMTAHAPYAGASHADYLDWFRANRQKKKLLPIYTDPDARVANLCRDRWISLRHHLLMGFKKVRRDI